jgi:hypothetical protein
MAVLIPRADEAKQCNRQNAKNTKKDLTQRRKGENEMTAIHITQRSATGIRLITHN